MNREPNPPLEARQLLRAHRYGALSTLSKKFNGHPFGSIMPYLVDHDGSLLILISTLAEHTKNILADPRVSLITHSQDNPHIQAQGRVTVVGTASVVEDREGAGMRYLRYFPEAKTYFAMHDFSFYRIAPLAIRYIGGFGNIHWVKAEDYSVPPYPLIEQEDGVVAHMNADHQDSLRNYSRHFHQYEAKQLEMLGIDCDGFDVRADEKVLRFDFSEPVLDAQQARAALVGMSRVTG
jgi:heme oxygenase (biliverdin-IX-beta and delta-forming)